MSDRRSENRSENRSKSLFIRSACMVMLIGISYGLQHFNETHAPVGTFETVLDSPDLERAQFSLGHTDLRQANERLKNGDLVFRSGDTWLSNMAEQVVPEVTYTHVGVILLERDQIKVVHASIEGNSLAETLGNRVVEEPLADFLQKGNATHAAIYRLRDPLPQHPAEASVSSLQAPAAEGQAAKAQSAEAQSAEAQSAQQAADNAAAIARTYAVKSVPFDSGFDLSSADKVYCTELIWRAYLDAGVDLADQGLDSFAFPFSGQYLMPDSLANSEKLQPVYQFNQVRAVNSATP